MLRYSSATDLQKYEKINCINYKVESLLLILAKALGQVLSPEKIKLHQVSDWLLVQKTIKISSEPEIIGLSVIGTGLGSLDKHVPKMMKKMYQINTT